MYDENSSEYGEGGDGHDEDISGDTVCRHDRGDFCDNHFSEKNTEKGRAMKKVKTIEILLSAVYTLIAAALAVIKFIKQIWKLKTEAAEG